MNHLRIIFHIFFIFYSTTKHEIIHIKNHNLLCSLDPPNQSRFFNWLAHYKRMRIADKNNVHCTFKHKNDDKS